MVSSWIPELLSVESHSFPVQGALASYPQARSRPMSQQPQDLFILIVLGETMGYSALLHPRAIWPCSRAPWWVGLCPLLLPPTIPLHPPVHKRRFLAPQMCLQPRWLLQSCRWSGFTFPKGSASDSPFTVHVLILGLCPISCFFFYIWNYFNLKLMLLAN